MSLPQFINDGVQVRTFDEIYTSLSNGLRSVYGNDINLDQNSPDGQMLGIIVKTILDMETFGLSLYTQFDPDFASGEMLNIIAKLIGIIRRPATQSQVDVTITTDRALTLPIGYTVQDINKNNWVTDSAKTLVSGANTVTLLAQDFGMIVADAGTVTEPVTIVLGVLSVTNPTAALVGIEEETDEEFRVRRNSSLENASYSTVGSLVAKLSNLANVTDAVVYENTTASTDSNGIPAHSIWPVVEGGTVSSIAESIVKSKTGGTGLKGLTTGTYTEIIIRPDLSTFIINHNVIFDRPTYVPIYINITCTRKDSAIAVDTALVSQKLASRLLRIGESMQANEMYDYAYMAGSTFVASALEISLDGITYTDGILIPAVNEKYTISTTNIVVTEVV